MQDLPGAPELEPEAPETAGAPFALYSEFSSPFSAAVRAAIYAKGLDIPVLPPPGGLKSVAYHKINPIGTVPCLVGRDGFLLPESAAIMEYLEERFPQKALLPQDPAARARVRLIQRIGELGIMTSIVDLMRMARTEPRDDAGVSLRLTRLVRSLASLQVFLGEGSYAVGGQFTLADCQLGPALYGLPLIRGAFGTGDLIAAYPKLAAYHAVLVEAAPVARVLDEMAGAGGYGASA